MLLSKISCLCGFDNAFLVTSRPKTGTFNHAYVHRSTYCDSFRITRRPKTYCLCVLLYGWTLAHVRLYSLSAMHSDIKTARAHLLPSQSRRVHCTAQPCTPSGSTMQHCHLLCSICAAVGTHKSARRILVFSLFFQPKPAFLAVFVLLRSEEKINWFLTCFPVRFTFPRCCGNFNTISLSKCKLNVQTAHFIRSNIWKSMRK